jgi:hypothetical protein
MLPERSGVQATRFPSTVSGFRFRFLSQVAHMSRRVVLHHAVQVRIAFSLDLVTRA